MGNFLKAKPFINYKCINIEILRSIAIPKDDNTLKG